MKKKSSDIGHHPRFINTSTIDDPGVAAAELRKTSYSVVGAWASCYDSVIALLSGGLDSSIVVSLLKCVSARPRVVCLNYRVAQDPSTDERFYARLVSTNVGYPVLEREQPVEPSLEPLLKLPKLVSPCQPIFEIAVSKDKREIASDHQAGAYFSGHGGDQLFFQNGAYYICADFLRTRGLRPRLLSLAMDAARIEGGALLPAIRRGFRDGLRTDPVAAVVRNYRFSSLIKTDVLESVRTKRLFVPTWLNGSHNIPPGKCWQAIGLSMENEMHGAFAPEDDPEEVFPLLSQPLQELCFQIPTYILTLNGVSRGLARASFTRELPVDILQRTAKAVTYDYVRATLDKNLGLVRSLLLDGVLVKERILDAVRLERALSGTLTGEMTVATDIIHLASTEAWLQSGELRLAVPPHDGTPLAIVNTSP